MLPCWSSKRGRGCRKNKGRQMVTKHSTAKGTEHGGKDSPFAQRTLRSIVGIEELIHTSSTLVRRAKPPSWTRASFSPEPGLWTPPWGCWSDMSLSVSRMPKTSPEKWENREWKEQEQRLRPWSATWFQRSSRWVRSSGLGRRMATEWMWRGPQAKSTWRMRKCTCYCYRWRRREGQRGIRSRERWGGRGNQYSE